MTPKKPRGVIKNPMGIKHGPSVYTEIMANNPRYSNGNLRRKNRARIKAMGNPCHICGKPIHYDEPSDYKHPLSFVIDEIIPVSKWPERDY